MNMFRAGVVEHPSQWEFCGYNVNFTSLIMKANFSYLAGLLLLILSLAIRVVI